MRMWISSSWKLRIMCHHRKKGSQQRRKAPMTRPRVTNAWEVIIDNKNGNSSCKVVLNEIVIVWWLWWFHSPCVLFASLLIVEWWWWWQWLFSVQVEVAKWSIINMMKLKIPMTIFSTLCSFRQFADLTARLSAAELLLPKTTSFASPTPFRESAFFKSLYLKLTAPQIKGGAVIDW